MKQKESHFKSAAKRKKKEKFNIENLKKKQQKLCYNMMSNHGGL